MVQSACISARFLGSSVFVAAVDSIFTIKIWNYKTNTLIQSLTSTFTKTQDTITDLLVFSQGKFAILSKHITFYDSVSQKMADDTPQSRLSEELVEIRRMILAEKGKSELDEAAESQRNAMIAPPLDVVFLNSYNNFLILTKDSIRTYNGKSGRLQMYLDNIAGE